MRQKVEKALKKIKPLIRGADIGIKDLKDGVLTLHIYTFRCGRPMAKDYIIGIVEEEMKDMVPEIKKIIIG